MSFRCKSCERELPEPPAPGTPCPGCGAALEPAAKRRAGGLIIALTTVVMLVVVVFMVLQRQPTAKGHGDITEGIQITITAPRPTAVRVDGAMVGKTPVVLKLKGGRSRAMTIEGNGVVKEVTPDRDQIVNLVPAP